MALAVIAVIRPEVKPRDFLQVAAGVQKEPGAEVGWQTKNEVGAEETQNKGQGPIDRGRGQ